MHQSYFMVCTSEQLKKSAEKIAILLGRKFAFVDSGVLSNFDVKSECVTIISLIKDVRLDIISEFMEKNIIFSVIAVKNESELLLYYKKIDKHRRISLNDRYIEDFLNSTPYISEKKLFNSRACFFTGHGDYMCFNMANAVLCSRTSKSEEIKQKAPRCIIENECYRKNRLTIRDAKLYSLQELSAEVIFLNTCSGLCFKNRKYNVYYNSLSDAFFENNGLVFISNYMIGAYTHVETMIFFSMLIYYKNFALTLCKYNQLVNCFYGKNKTAVMVGDISIEAIVKKQCMEKCFHITVVDESHIVIKFKGELVLNTITFEIDKNSIPVEFNLLNTIPIDSNNECNYRLGILSEDSFYKVFIYSPKTGLFENEIIFYQKKKFTDWSLTIYEQLEFNSSVLDLYLFDGDYPISLGRSCNFLKQKISQNINIQEMDKGNLEITTYAYNILRKATVFISEFNISLIRCFIETSQKSDTHLILDNTKFFLRSIGKSISLCSVCYNQIWKMHMEAKCGIGYYIQYICPECEIFCISNDYENESNMKLQFNQHTCDVYLSKNNDFITPCVGSMIINTDISTTKVDFLKSNCLVMHLDLKGKCLMGMYYLRVVILENKKTTILHKRLYFSTEEV